MTMRSAPVCVRHKPGCWERFRVHANRNSVVTCSFQTPPGLARCLVFYRHNGDRNQHERSLILGSSQYEEPRWYHRVGWYGSQFEVLWSDPSMRSRAGTARWWTGEGPSMRGAVEPHGGLGGSQYEEQWYHTLDWEGSQYERSRRNHTVGWEYPSMRSRGGITRWTGSIPVRGAVIPGCWVPTCPLCLIFCFWGSSPRGRPPHPLPGAGESKQQVADSDPA